MWNYISASEALCFPIVGTSEHSILVNVISQEYFEVFLQIWHKYPPGLKGELISFFLVMKCQCDLTKQQNLRQHKNSYSNYDKISDKCLIRWNDDIMIFYIQMYVRSTKNVLAIIHRYSSETAPWQVHRGITCEAVLSKKKVPSYLKWRDR